MNDLNLADTNFWSKKLLLTYYSKQLWNVAKVDHVVWKLLRMSHLNFGILAFSTNFCPIKTDMSGNTIWHFCCIFMSLEKTFSNFDFFHEFFLLFSKHVLITTSTQNDWAIIFSFLYVHCSTACIGDSRRPQGVQGPFW